MATMTLSPSVSSPTRSTVARHDVRLTGRGRLVVLLALLVIGLVALSLGRIATQASPPSSGASPAVTQVWVVAPGETLWTIATRIEPNTDPRITVQRIIDLNGLGDAGVFAGERLIVPGRG